MAFQQRLTADPDSVSDDEFRAEYGDDIPPSELRELFRRRTFGKESKAPRASARAKLRRRLVWLKDSLDAVEHAVNQIIASPGRTYKQKELSDLLAAIEQFRATARLPERESASPFDSDLLHPATELDIFRVSRKIKKHKPGQIVTVRQQRTFVLPGTYAKNSIAMTATAPAHSAWDLRQLRENVQRTYGQLQRDAISPCLNTVVERRFFARFHFNEARDMLDAALVGSRKMDLVGRVLGGYDAEHGPFEEVRRRAAAHINACVHAMHSLPDVLGQVIYLSLGMNRDPATELQERYTTIYAVRDKLPSGKLRDLVEQLVGHEDFAYLAVLNNMSKHRSIVPVPYSIDMTGEDPEEHGLKFSDFIYDGAHYDARWVRPFLVAEYQRQEALVLEVGLTLNAELGARQADT